MAIKQSEQKPCTPTGFCSNCQLPLSLSLLLLMHSFLERAHATWLLSALIYVLQHAACMQMLQGGQQFRRTRPLTGLLMPTGLYDVLQCLWHVSALNTHNCSDLDTKPTDPSLLVPIRHHNSAQPIASPRLAPLRWLWLALLLQFCVSLDQAVLSALGSVGAITI